MKGVQILKTIPLLLYTQISAEKILVQAKNLQRAAVKKTRVRQMSI